MEGQVSFGVNSMVNGYRTRSEANAGKRCSCPRTGWSLDYRAVNWWVMRSLCITNWLQGRS